MRDRRKYIQAPENSITFELSIYMWNAYRGTFSLTQPTNKSAFSMSNLIYLNLIDMIPNVCLFENHI